MIPVYIVINKPKPFCLRKIEKDDIDNSLN